jgi:uncharacterized membrane protein
MNNYLLSIFIISIAGILFSGFLSYKELFKKSCPLGSCGQKIAGIPVCVYGLIMYLIIFVISLLGILAG